MPVLKLYDTLLEFPLFKGMGHEELSMLVSRTKLEFIKLQKESETVRKNIHDNRLLLLINGKLRAITYSADKAYSLTESIPSPYIIEPERLFGLHQKSTSIFTAETEANIIAIDKTEVARLCDTFVAFRLNIINLLATEVQRRVDELWQAPPADLRGRIVRFIKSRCLLDHGHKVLNILMERLAAEVNDSRLDVSHALRAMREDGMIETGRGRIVVAAIEKLK